MSDQVKYKVALVIWEDATSIDPWVDEAEVFADSCHLVHSVGFVIAKDSERVTLALNHDTGSDSLSCIMLIPNGMVRAFVPLT